jgi:hypothetical protein
VKRDGGGERDTTLLDSIMFTPTLTLPPSGGGKTLYYSPLLKKSQ